MLNSSWFARLASSIAGDKSLKTSFLSSALTTESQALLRKCANFGLVLLQIACMYPCLAARVSTGQKAFRTLPLNMAEVLCRFTD
jgi:hypothetical protein